MRKTDTTRIPLIQAGAVLLLFVLLAYLTGTSAEGSVLNSLAMIIVGALQLIWFAIGMCLATALCLAFLIGVFFLAVWMADRTAVAPLYASLMQALHDHGGPLCTRLGRCCPQRASAMTAPAPAAPVAPADDGTASREKLRALLAEELAKVSSQQQALIDSHAAAQSEQLAALQGKIQELEAKSAAFAATAQLDTVTGELAAFQKTLAEVQTQAAALDGKLQATAQQVGSITPDKVLGDLPARIDKLEEQGAGFDPTALAESVAALQQELENSKKKPAPRPPAKGRKKPSS